MQTSIRQIEYLPCWQGEVSYRPLAGGLTNRNFLVEDGSNRFVVRLGGDMPVHHIMRFNEQAASRAAASAGISPAVTYTEPGVLVLQYIDAAPYTPADVREQLDEAVALVRRVHTEIPHHLRGPVLMFWVFQVIRDYAKVLIEGRYDADFEHLLHCAVALETAVGPVNLVFGHNDLLASNFLHDGKRLWLIDWDYAGFNTPLFDLGGLASNNGFSAEQETRMLEIYFDAPVSPDLQHRYLAMKAASLLRETMWSMVSESQSTLDFDYKTYSQTNLAQFSRAWTHFKQA